MNSVFRGLGLSLCLAWVTGPALGQDAVISDDGVTMSRAELEYIVSKWKPQMQQDAANDLGDRFELLNQAFATKKLAGEADSLTPEKDGPVYWEKELLVRQLLQQYMVQQFINSIPLPELEGLAQERYATEKDKYARVPPQRMSSHILLLCPQGDGSCDRPATLARAQQILSELQVGADFEALVKEYSQDPGSKDNKGRLNKWLEPGTKDVDRAYLKAVFALEKEGDYSGVVTSKFGLHIIRLDKAKESYYKTYEEARPEIVKALTQEYLNLKVKVFDEGYRFTDDLYIDGDAMEEIFSQYKTQE